MDAGAGETSIAGIKRRAERQAERRAEKRAERRTERRAQRQAKRPRRSFRESDLSNDSSNDDSCNDDDSWLAPESESESEAEVEVEVKDSDSDSSDSSSDSEADVPVNTWAKYAALCEEDSDGGGGGSGSSNEYEQAKTRAEALERCLFQKRSAIRKARAEAIAARKTCKTLGRSGSASSGARAKHSEKEDDLERLAAETAKLRRKLERARRRVSKLRPGATQSKEGKGSKSRMGMSEMWTGPGSATWD